MSESAPLAVAPALEKCPTGIRGLDEITEGGLPRGRPTLVCGGAGSGKTVLGVTFLVNGAVQFGEPGVLMNFEETAEDVAANVASLGFDVPGLVAEKKLAVDHVRIERSEIEETGEYDLEALFVRLGYAVDAIGARRVVLDTLEALFAGFTNESVLRAELRRLFRWLRDRRLTAIVTAERGNGSLTRHGLEEYVSDAVILLDHRVQEQVSTRRVRIVKYRGSAHGTSEYPFLIDRNGIGVIPVSSAGLDHPASAERISTGIERLDTMLDGHGYFRGSTILVSGTAGSGKTSVAAHFANAACRRGERCLVFLFEESPRQLIRNMRSIGLDLERWRTDGTLRFHAARPTLYGLETHLARMHAEIEEFGPRVVVVDPITNLVNVGTSGDVRAMLTRLIDHLKTADITALFTSLTQGKDERAETEVGVSSLMDAWLLLTAIEIGGERNRALQVLKSRGMAHSNQIREFLLTDRGVQLVHAYIGSAGVLTGSARLAQEAADTASATVERRELERKQRELEQRRLAFEAEVASLRARLATDEAALTSTITELEARVERRGELGRQMARSRSADAAGPRDEGEPR
jgi:circadian clock protein KaiC